MTDKKQNEPFQLKGSTQKESKWNCDNCRGCDKSRTHTFSENEDGTVDCGDWRPKNMNADLIALKKEFWIDGTSKLWWDNLFAKLQELFDQQPSLELIDATVREYQKQLAAQQKEIEELMKKSKLGMTVNRRDDYILEVKELKDKCAAQQKEMTSLKEVNQELTEENKRLWHMKIQKILNLG